MKCAKTLAVLSLDGGILSNIYFLSTLLFIFRLQINTCSFFLSPTGQVYYFKNYHEKQFIIILLLSPEQSFWQVFYPYAIDKTSYTIAQCNGCGIRQTQIRFKASCSSSWGLASKVWTPLKAQCPSEYIAVAGAYIQGWIGTCACSGKSVILGAPSKGSFEWSFNFYLEERQGPCRAKQRPCSSSDHDP